MNKILRQSLSGVQSIPIHGLPSIFRILILVVCFGFNSAFTQAQDLSISGTISDDTGLTLPGATILEKGTSNGVSTDIDGNFTMTVSSDNAVLVISFIGFVTQEVQVNGETVHNITMVTDAAALDEVVVTGYGVVKRNEFVGATSVVKGEVLTIAPLVTMEQGMRGQLAGVQVTSSSGQPGAGVSVRIRGVSSMAGGTEPLYVIDGIPFFNDDVRGLNGMSSINPADIESIEVLKDASSTSIYGSRAANGVIQITTKGGRHSGGVRINYDLTLSSQDVRNRYNMMNSEEWLDYADQYVTAASDWDAAEKADVRAELLSAGNADTNWQDEIFKTAFLQTHNLSFTGGNANNSYFVSVGYTDQSGVVVNTDFSRLSMRANLKNRLNKAMVLDTRVSLSQSVSNGFLASQGTNTNNLGKSGIGSTIKALPTAPIFNEDGTFADVGIYSFADGDIENPMGMTEALDRQRLNRLNAALTLRSDIGWGISNTTRVSIDLVERKNDTYYPEHLAQLGSQTAKLETKRLLTSLVESFFDYKHSFGKLEFDFLLGGSANSIESERLYMNSTGFPSDVLQNNAIQAGSIQGIPESFLSEQTLASFFTRVKLNYNKKYLLSIDARTDGTSVFSEDNKWANFGAIGGGWIISNEDFMDGSIFNEMKARVSYGSSGNQAIRPYQSLLLGQVVLTGQTAGSGIAVGLAPNLPNPNVTWETTVQANFGMDFGLQNNKYRLSFDVYKKNTEDLLATVLLPQSSGFSSIIDNIGEVENKGFEIQLGADIVEKGDWYFAVDAQFSKNNNKVIETKDHEDIFSGGGNNDASQTNTVIREGEPLYSFWAKHFIRMGEDGQPIYANEDGSEDLEGTGDNQIVGSSLPDFSYGFNTYLDYKNWSLVTNWAGVSGNRVNNTVLYQNSGHGLGNNLVNNILEYYPVINDQIQRSRSDRFIQDASYLRMANIKLNWAVGVANVKWLDALNIYFSGQNLITVTDYEGFDPEVNTFSGNDARQGSDLGGYPTTKAFTFGLNVSF